jgi:hypothetical protein
MAQIDDPIQWWRKWIVLPIVTRLAHHSFSGRKSRTRKNHKPPQSGIQKRNKARLSTGPSCQTGALPRADQADLSMACEFFTDDRVPEVAPLERQVCPVGERDARHGRSHES